MDGCMAGWMAGWLAGWMNSWLAGWLERWVGRWTDGMKERRMNWPTVVWQPSLELANIASDKGRKRSSLRTNGY